MVSSQHEAAHRIFHERPELLTSVFRILGVELPERASIEVLSADVTEIRPLERRVDCVLRLRPHNGKRSFLLAIETQGRRDADKERSWTYYQAFLQAKYKEEEVLLLILCTDQSTAKWASGPFLFGFGGWTALRLTPLVLGPENVPVIVKQEDAEADLALAAFSALTHGRSRDITAILDSLARAMNQAGQEAVDYYAEFVEVGLDNTPAGDYWRALVQNGSYFPGRGTVAERKFLEGEAKGEVKGKADAVLRLMAMRGMELSADDQARVRACRDLAVLDRWFDRAVSATRAEDLFAEPASGA